GTGILMPAIYSSGRAATGLRISLSWTALTWLSAVVLAQSSLGFQTIAMAYVLGTVIALCATVRAVHRFVPLNLTELLAKPLVSGLVLTAILYTAGSVFVRSLWSLVVLASAALSLGLMINIWED